MKEETILGLAGAAALVIIGLKVGSGVSTAIGDIGGGVSNALTGAGDALRYTGAGTFEIGSGVGYGVGQIGAGIGDIGSGVGSGLRDIGSGTGYAISGANLQDILQTILSGGKEASTYSTYGYSNFSSSVPAGQGNIPLPNSVPLIPNNRTSSVKSSGGAGGAIGGALQIVQASPVNVITKSLRSGSSSSSSSTTTTSSSTPSPTFSTIREVSTASATAASINPVTSWTSGIISSVGNFFSGIF